MSRHTSNRHEQITRAHQEPLPPSRGTRKSTLDHTVSTTSSRPAREDPASVLLGGAGHEEPDWSTGGAAPSRKPKPVVRDPDLSHTSSPVRRASTALNLPINADVPLPRKPNLVMGDPDLSHTSSPVRRALPTGDANPPRKNKVVFRRPSFSSDSDSESASPVLPDQHVSENNHVSATDHLAVVDISSDRPSRVRKVDVNLTLQISSRVRKVNLNLQISDSGPSPVDAKPSLGKRNKSSAGGQVLGKRRRNTGNEEVTVAPNHGGDLE